MSTLSEAILELANDTGIPKYRFETDSVYLGRLACLGVDVKGRVANIYSRLSLDPMPCHHCILNIFPCAGAIRIITTSIDALFEKAAMEKFESAPKVFSAPTLPLEDNFTGIANLHGLVSCSDELILTDSDFGRIYLTEGWASSFLRSAIKNHIVLLTGFNAGDGQVQYILNALSLHAECGLYSLVNFEDEAKYWDLLGVVPVLFSTLCNALSQGTHC